MPVFPAWPVFTVFLHLLSTLFPVTMVLYCLYNSLTLFVPLMGRAGPGAVPDVFIAVLVALGIIGSMSYNVGTGGEPIRKSLKSERDLKHG